MTGQKERNDFDAENFSILEEFISAYDLEGDSLMQVLSRVREKLGYLPEDLQRHMAQEMRHYSDPGVIRQDLAGYFPRQVDGFFHIRTCGGRTCYLPKPPGLMTRLCQVLDILPGMTTEDGAFTLGEIACTGFCNGNPPFFVNNRVIENMKSLQVPKLIRLLRSEYLKRGN